MIWPHIWEPNERCEAKSIYYIVINRFCKVMYLSFEIPLLTFFYFFRMFIWTDHVRCSSNTRPRYFVGILVIYYLLAAYLKVHIFYLLSFQSKNYYFCFTTFNEILSAQSQWTISFKSWFMYLFICFRELLEYRRLVSSAKCCITEELHQCWIT